MNILQVHIGIKLEIEELDNNGEKKGPVYTSQLMETIDTENVVIAAPIHEQQIILFPIGTRLRMVFLDEHKVPLSFTGTVELRTKQDNIIALQTRIYSSFDKIQRRRYYRLDSFLDAMYREHDEGISEKGDIIKEEIEFKKCYTKNISGSGLSLIISESVPSNSLLEVIVNLSKEKTIKAICKVVRKTLIEDQKGKRYDMGLDFIKISARDQDNIIKFIFDQQRANMKRD